MKKNEKMKNLIDELGLDFHTAKNCKLPLELQEIVDQGVIFSKGILIFSTNLKTMKHTSSARFIDLTGLECFINKTSVDSYLENPSRKELLGVLISFFYATSKILRTANKPIKIIAGFQDDEFLTATLRFHLIREGEDWLVPDLESYKEDALMIDNINCI